MFEDFEQIDIDTGEVTIHGRRGGAGPPLLLLHGHPQTHVMWHSVAPVLAQRFTVVATDLRGYGDSSKPATTADHEPYSKRAMARDQVAVMTALGYERFAVVGHDRGARCAYRLTLDHPHRVTQLAVLDIIPTLEMWDRWDRALSLVNWHWSFLAQSFDVPERIIGADPRAYFTRKWPAHDQPPPQWSPEAAAEYLRCYLDPATVHAICEDYRAGASIDVEHDAADRGVRRIACPLLVLWSAREELARFDPVAIWRDWADDVRGHGVDAGHFLAEEAPDDVLDALLGFLGDGTGRLPLPP